MAIFRAPPPVVPEHVPYVEAASGRPTVEFFRWVQTLFSWASSMSSSSFVDLPGDYANDAAAAAGGVPVGGIYRNGSVLMVRVA